MIYLPDTNAWIRFLNPGETPVKERFLASDATRIWLCSIASHPFHSMIMLRGNTEIFVPIYPAEERRSARTT